METNKPNMSNTNAPNMSNTNAPKDVFITKINHIKPHDNADTLELAYVKNWQCVVRKDTFKIGDTVLYIVPDAMLDVNAAWCEGFVKYLGKGGRVKTVALRGQKSCGILIDINEPYIQDVLGDVEVESLDSETIAKMFGIGHYTPPAPTDLTALRMELPDGVEKSDEENWQSLDECDLHLGEPCLVTKKMDGSSAVIYYNPADDNLEICSRSMSLKLDCENNYTRALLPYVDTVKFLARYTNGPVAIRGEVCGNNINANKANFDAKGQLCFYMYGTRFPNAESIEERMGRYGQVTHFLIVNDFIKDVIANKETYRDVYGDMVDNIKAFKTVPIIGEETITMELLTKYRDMPKDFGEGVVLNGHTFSYKSKSDDYYAAMK